MKNLDQLMKQAQELQSKMAEAQQRLGEATATGLAGGGLVSVTLNGHQQMTAIKIDPSLANPSETEILEDLILAAFNDAKTKVAERVQQEMKNVTGGIDLPPGFNMPT